MNFRSEREIMEMDIKEKEKYYKDIDKYVIAYNKVKGIKKLSRYLKRKLTDIFYKKFTISKKINK